MNTFETNATKIVQEQLNDFIKTDLRVARIVEAEDVIDADKLLKITVDLGAKKEQSSLELKVFITQTN